MKTHVLSVRYVPRISLQFFPLCHGFGQTHTVWSLRNRGACSGHSILTRAEDSFRPVSAANKKKEVSACRKEKMLRWLTCGRGYLDGECIEPFKSQKIIASLNTKYCGYTPQSNEIGVIYETNDPEFQCYFCWLVTKPLYFLYFAPFSTEEPACRLPQPLPSPFLQKSKSQRKIYRDNHNQRKKLVLVDLTHA